MRKDKTKAQISIRRDLNSALLASKIPAMKIIRQLQAMTYQAIKTGDTSAIERICHGPLLQLLNSTTEVSVLKGGRRAQLSAEKVIDEPVNEIAPVRFSLRDEDNAQAAGVANYLKRVSGIDPKRSTDEFERQNLSLINGLSDEICDTIRKSIEVLTRNGTHVHGGTIEIAKALAAANLNPAVVPRLAETIFRTQSAQAYNAGRWNVVNDPDIGEYIWGFEYCTVGDDRVRPEHRLLEGVKLPKDDPFWKKYLPPNGWNCRCTVLEIWEEEDEAKIDYGITGRDPRKRSDEELNLMPAFAGNVGIFSKPEPTKETVIVPAPEKKKTWVTDTPNPDEIQRIQNEMNNQAKAILEQFAVESFDAREVVGLKCRPFRGGRGFLDWEFGWEFKEDRKIFARLVRRKDGFYFIRTLVHDLGADLKQAFIKARRLCSDFRGTHPANVTIRWDSQTATRSKNPEDN